MDDLLNEFLTETAENMETLDTELIKLEQNPNDQAILSNIFRLVHTIKGTCGFLGLPRLESVAHASENVLGRVRDGKLEVTAGSISLVLESIDQIKMILNGLEKNEAEPEGEDSDLIKRLNHLAETGSMPGDEEAITEETASTDAELEASDPRAMEAPAAKPVGAAAFDAMLNSEEVAVDSAELQAAFDNAVYIPPEKPGVQDETQASADEITATSPAEAVASVPATTGQQAVAAEEGKAALAEKSDKAGAGIIQTIRVNVDLLENLMTMVSELVLTRNQLLQILRNQGDSEYSVPLQRLSHVTSELQEGVMKTRMQPIGNAWAKLPRIVRDLSVELGRKIDLQMLGAETELDRQVLEIIKDPLTHMVRNSADHGIESPEDRVAAGKGDTGTITLNAYHEGGHILIRISDDGKGLPLQAIKNKILKNELATEAEIADMTEHQIQQYIFAAGFSTAAHVTAVSGRGVGMDVVKSNIDKIGGTVELTSVEGKGTTFTIKIPLTLAIVSALIVECGTERFAVPQISVVELVRASANADHKIEMIHGTPVLRLRNRLLPLVNLRKLLDVEGADDLTDLSEAFIVVSQVGNNTFGIIVDRIFDAEEIVVKPISYLLRQIPVFGGNTILGDGSVIMILDPNGIAQSMGDAAVVDHKAAGVESIVEDRDDRVAMLLFRAVDRQRKAVPLALVARLEEIDFEKVEYANGRAMVQYRGTLMPLMSVDSEASFPESGKKPTLVFSDRSRSMGLVVDEILDIVEDRLVMEHGASRTGFIGSAIIADHATEIIDTPYFLMQAFPDWFSRDQGGGSLHESSRRKFRVLLVDDSAFFRNLLSPVLSVAGYDVTTAISAEAAMKLYQRGEHFDGIISDIEMPGMNGFEFVAELRGGEGRWKDIPIVAMSSHTSPEDLIRGDEVGFTDYVAKHDREGLLQALSDSISQNL